MDKIMNYLSKIALPALMQFLRVSKELLITVLLSFSPILLSSVVVAAWTKTPFTTFFIDSFKHGEVFIYTAAFLTPYIINRLEEGTKDLFKEICFYMFIAALGCGALMFISVRIETVINTPMELKESTQKLISFSVAISTLFIWYYSVWPKHYKSLNTNKTLEEEQNDLNKQLDAELGK